MAAPAQGTCEPWATVADVSAPCAADGFDVDLLEDALQIASDALWHLTGRRWGGECTRTIRPCGYRRADSCGCTDSRSCACKRLSSFMLPGVVASVDEVKIDGDVVDPARYRVDDWRWLVYLPGDGTRQGWPCCQRLDRADTEDDTWSVTYSFGSRPPAGGRRAAALLGCELALSFDPSTVGECKLPRRVTSITRQGVSMALLDPLELFSEGRTGLTAVDLWLESVRVGEARRRAAVWVPGQPRRGHRRTGT